MSHPLALVLTVALATSALAARAPAPSSAPARTSRVAILPGAAIAGLPRWTPPAAYSEQLVVESEGKTIVMHRLIDREKMRTDMSVDGRQFTMIELGDEKGTSYMLMPEQKRAMKQSRGEMAALAGGTAKPDSTAAAQDDFTTEDLGEETLGGVVTKKLRLVSKEGDALAWFDKATGAPVRMESAAGGNKAVISWKERKAGPQPAAEFEIPKGYDVMDMDEMRAKMGAMGGMGGMAGGALGGIKGMGGGMAGSMGSSLGGNLGGMLGGSLGGPLGSIAGRYIGGKIGGALGRKAAGAVTH